MLPPLRQLCACLCVHVISPSDFSFKWNDKQLSDSWWLTVISVICVSLFQGQTWSPSIDDEGSTRDEFYDDEDLYSGSGSGCKCVCVCICMCVCVSEVTHTRPASFKLDSCWVSICWPLRPILLLLPVLELWSFCSPDSHAQRPRTHNPTLPNSPFGLTRQVSTETY